VSHSAIVFRTQMREAFYSALEHATPSKLKQVVGRALHRGLGKVWMRRGRK